MIFNNLQKHVMNDLGNKTVTDYYWSAIYQSAVGS
jgi:hypothetical protein